MTGTAVSRQQRQDLNKEQSSVAAWIVHSLRQRGVNRVFGLQGGHIQPIWDFIARAGISIVDVRDERAAVYMAHAQAELTGKLGVALATAGPGVTNAVTAIANASLARVPVLLIGGCTSSQQVNMGALQEIPHTEIMRPITRYARTARVAEQAVRELDEAIARATGDLGEPGPSYIEFPTDVLRLSVRRDLILEEWLRPMPRRRLVPDPDRITEAVTTLQNAKRPLVISGRGARNTHLSLQRFLDLTEALYLDTQESRGLVSADHPSVVGAARGAAMAEADLVITLGRKLDYQLGYGSPAVFPNASFLRIADTDGELMDNRRGTPEILADVSLALDAIADGIDPSAATRDTEWLNAIRSRHQARIVKNQENPTPSLGADGKIHPLAIFTAISQVADPNYIGIADGGDLLSFARIGLQARTYLDSGAFGCLGVGIPFAVAAALTCPDRQVISVSGDGAFGFNAMEIDTAVRHGAKAVFIISNNAAWNIERVDQDLNYGGRVAGTLLNHCDYATMARGLGAYAERVEDPAELSGAIARGLAQAPAVIDVITSQEAISSDAKKGLGFVPDYQPLLYWDAAECARRQQK